MNTKQKHGLLNKVIAILLVITMTCVYVVGDSYAPVIVERNKHESTDLLSQTLSYSTDVMPNLELKDVSELVLAKSTTNMGKASQSLLEAYADMPRTVKNSSELESSVSYFKEQIANLKGQSFKELIKTDNGTEEFNVYKNAVTAGYAQLEELLSDVNVDNYEEVLADISALINPERPYVSLADDLPFNDVSEDNISYSTYNPESVESYQIDNGSYSDDDLKQTNDTIINDDVRSEFTDLASVLEVYQYIKNNYTMEFYFGSRKGAVGTSAEKAGNDYDIASLLISVLRDRNIPARYAKGEIEITAAQAMEWTATDDINVAMRVISALGIPTTGMVSNGETVAVRLEHVWVEAYVPYTDYRGTGNRSGERMWIPLDASFKKSIHIEGNDIEAINAYMNDESNYLNENSIINGVSVSNIAQMIDGKESAFVKYMLENGYDSIAQVFGGKEIIYEDLGYLPLSLPYTTTSDVKKYDDIPLDYTDSINFELFGNSASGNSVYGNDFINNTIYAPDVYGKRLTLAYIPASTADSDVIAEYGGIFSTPAYLVKMKPQFIIDGEVIAEGSICNLGYTQKYIINLSNKASGQNDSEITNIVTVGGMYSIVLDYGNISELELRNAKSVVESFKDTATEDNCYTEHYMGEMLYAIGKMYFSQLDTYNEVVAGVHNVTSTRSLSVGIIGFKANPTYSFGIPSEIKEGGIFLDIGHDVHCVVSNDNINESEKKFMLEAGMYASAMEHGILEQVTGVESVSTIKALQYAQQNNIPIHYITKDNADSELSQITFAPQLISDIRSSINAGKIIIIPEHDITINQWTGVGYMVLDPDTFACGYMISGGLAGGAMSAGEVIWETFKATVEGIFWGLCIAFFVWLFPALLIPVVIAGIIGYGFMLYSIGSHMYNAVLYEDVREFQLAMIEASSFMLTSAFFLKLSKWWNIEYDDPAGAGESNGKTPVEKANAEAGGAKSAGCFISGTLISTPNGLTPIESIVPGDIVWSFNPETLEVSKNQVEKTFTHQSNCLIRITTENGIISATSNHPFYVATKGFVAAISLRAGDILINVNGERVIINKIQHEILESPVDVFNFSVANDHTYFVGDAEIGVHNNSGGSTTKNLKISKVTESVVRRFSELHTKYQAGASRNVATLDGEINGEYYSLESVSGKVKMNSNGTNNKGNFTPADKFYYDYVGDEPISTRYYDTEYKMIDYIRSLYDGNHSVSGKIKITTEQTACPSCRSVIEQFAKDFPNIEIELIEP